MKVKVIVLSLLGLSLILGCKEVTTKDGDVIICTTEYVPALSIDVFDKETGLPNACGVTVVVQDGDYIEEISNEAGNNCQEDFTFKAAGERAGTYDITVSKEGYIDWVHYDTEVTENICHVNTISVQAYLEK
jgi:hypothetical protein